MKIKSTDRILFLDASSYVVQVGILSGGRWVGYFRSEEAALQSVFQGVEVSLGMAGLELGDITGFAYCEGPGSLLGIRLVAMAIRGWKVLEGFREVPVYGYSSFEVSLALIKKVHNPEGAYGVVMSVGKGSWSILMSGEGGKVVEVSEDELKLLSASLPGGIWVFKQRKISGEEGDFEKRAFDYSIEGCAEVFGIEGGGLLRLVDEVDAVVREQEYVKWDSKRHQINNMKEQK